MTDKKYTHKIVMFDVNGLVRTARFTSEKSSGLHWKWKKAMGSDLYIDDSGVRFNMNNIVQINPVEVIEG